MQTPTNNTNSNWKIKAYLIGILSGVAFGLLSAYLYARTAEENESGKPSSISTTQLLGLSLTVLGLVRQVSSMGQTDKKKK